MQVGGVRFRSFLFYFFILVFFSHSCHRSLRNPGNVPKIMFHEKFAPHDIYILVYLRIKRKQVKNLSQEALKVVII